MANEAETTGSGSALTSDQRRVGPFSGKIVSIVAVVTIIAMLYGIAQPAILRLFGVDQGKELTAADVISVLVAVLGLLAATIGVLIYSVVRRVLDERMAAQIAASELQRGYRHAEEMLQVTAFATTEAWQRLVPYLVGATPLHDPGEAFQKALRDSIIKYGLECSEDADHWLQRADPATKNGRLWPPTVALNHALFLACRVLSTGTHTDSDAAEARRLLPSLDQVSSDDAKEIIAWVKVCCYRPWSEEWEEGRSLANRLMMQTENPAWRLRYHAAFPDAFPAS